MYEYVDWSAYQDVLYHHGIFGMKWGIRRYQNPDGSLTEAGRKRYGVDGGKPGKESGSVKTKPKLSKSDIEGMSDDDLRKLVQRTELEQRYEQLVKEPEPKKSLSTVQKTINFMSEYGGKAMAVASTAIALLSAYKAYQEKYGDKAKGKEANKDLEALKKKIEELQSQSSKNSAQGLQLEKEIKDMAKDFTRRATIQPIPKDKAITFGKEIVDTLRSVPASSVSSSNMKALIPKEVKGMKIGEFVRQHGYAVKT